MKLHYAQKIADAFAMGRNTIWQMTWRIWNAAKWGNTDKALIRNLFRDQYLYSNGTHDRMERFFV